jgi:hypothetical protein
MFRILPLAALAVLSACATVPSAPTSPQAALFARLTTLCGQAFGGALVTSEAADADMAGKAMVMHVRHCTPTEIRIPFHVQTGPASAGEAAWDRSRTWIITRTATGLRLKHDHRHKDGSADPVTFYGGDTASPGTAARQEFPVDAESIASFRANGLARSVTNVWAVEVDASRFAYVLRRTGANARHFRVEFDLTRPVPAPPPAWGW